MLAGRAQPRVDARRARAVPEAHRPALRRMLPPINRILNYVHQRTMQRLTLAAIERGDLPQAPLDVSIEFVLELVVEVPDPRRVAAGDLGRSSSATLPIISSMVLREYGQSLPWCG